MFYLFMYIIFSFAINSYYSQPDPAFFPLTISVKNEQADAFLRPYKIAEHLGCALQETERGPNATTCMEASFRRLYKIVILRSLERLHADDEFILPAIEKRSRLPRPHIVDNVRTVGPKFLQEPISRAADQEPNSYKLAVENSTMLPQGAWKE